METVLLDTDVVSFIFKKDTRAAFYQKHLEGKVPAISFMTVAELFQWAEVRQWGVSRRRQLEESLKAYTILPFDIHVCRLWGAVRAMGQASGKRISAQDAWIAACALHYDLPLITNNSGDFQIVEGLHVITA